MINFDVAQSQNDLQSILNLQKINLPKNISESEAREQGFVTVEHNLDLLTEMNSPFPHIVARDNGEVIGYALVMMRSLESKIPILVPMFEQINQIEYEGRFLKEAKYFIMGQICIGKGYRGKGIFKRMYDEMKKRMCSDFDYVITEVAARNVRSMKAHYKVGFENIKEYKGDLGEDWVIVLLKLKN